MACFQESVDLISFGLTEVSISHDGSSTGALKELKLYVFSVTSTNRQKLHFEVEARFVLMLIPHR